jgi:hypothetical protein
MSQQVSTLNKLQVIEALYRRGYHSDFIDKTVDKLLSIECSNAHRELAELEARLQELEGKHKMSSEDFYHRFQKGDLGDSADFFEWSAFYDMWQAVSDRLKNLELRQP